MDGMEAGRSAWGPLRLREDVLDQLRQGVCVFDQQRRLLLWNRRYVEMYRLDPRDLHEGTTLPEVVDLRFAAGTGPDMELAEYLAWRDSIQVRLDASDTVVVLRNGDVHEIHHQPAPDGGWVATFDDITERRRVAAHVQHMAHHDALTDLPNRVLFAERLAGVLDGRAGGEAVAVMCLDLDRFKAVNDTLGHAAGDALLQQAAARMRAELRQSDTLARLGGDEFAAILPLRDAEEAAACAARIVRAMAEPFVLRTPMMTPGAAPAATVGVSVGIVLCEPGSRWEPGRALRCADLALYRAKAEGRNGFRFFQPGMDIQLERRRVVERDLARALDRGELLLHYQPQFDLATGACCGREALVRWRRDVMLVPPSEFIPVAEVAGLIGAIGAWVLRTACAAAAAWPDLRLAVNLSPVQVRSEGLVEAVAAALRDTGLAPDRLDLEITEGVLLDDTPCTLDVLHGIRRLGVGLVLDDFGKGYSSLGYLRRFPFTKLKIDRAFMDVQDAGNVAIVRAVAALGRELGMRVTAEGIETATQLQAMRELGCDEGQGYFLGRPG